MNDMKRALSRAGHFEHTQSGLRKADLVKMCQKYLGPVATAEYLKDDDSEQGDALSSSLDVAPKRGGRASTRAVSTEPAEGEKAS